LPEAELDRVVGTYNFGGAVVIAITREGDGLRAQRVGVPGAQAAPIYPEAPLAFFWRVLDAQIRFTADASGKVTGAELTQGAAHLTGTRVDP
jgi:hypothetical protein